MPETIAQAIQDIKALDVKQTATLNTIVQQLTAIAQGQADQNIILNQILSEFVGFAAKQKITLEDRKTK